MPTLAGTLGFEDVPFEPQARCMPNRCWNAQPPNHSMCPRGYPMRVDKVVQMPTWRIPMDDPLPDLPPKVGIPQLTLFLSAPKRSLALDGAVHAAQARLKHRNRRARSLDSAMPTSSQLERISLRGRDACKTLPSRREREHMKEDRREVIEAAKKAFGVLPKVDATSLASTSSGPSTMSRSAKAGQSSATSTLRRCNSSGGAALQEPCPICYEELRPSDMETLGCDVHYMCGGCASCYATNEVRSGRLPRCINEKCRKVIEPLVALRLLTGEDHSFYLQMALWLNPRVEACPKCRELLFSEEIAPCGKSATCPNCQHVFCADCRNPYHPGKSCEETYLQDSLGDNLGEDDTIRHIYAAGLRCKVCPRCRVMVEKADDESCDHMTCSRCHHEFCWICSADRSVIYAHGNHYHRMFCKHYAEYKGPEEYLPTKCARCELRGSACRAPSVHLQRSLPPAYSVAFTTFVDACSSFTRDSFTRAINCNFMRVNFQNKAALGATELSL